MHAIAVNTTCCRAACNLISWALRDKLFIGQESHIQHIHPLSSRHISTTFGAWNNIFKANHIARQKLCCDETTSVRCNCIEDSGVQFYTVLFTVTKPLVKLALHCRLSVYFFNILANKYLLKNIKYTDRRQCRIKNMMIIANYITKK